LAVLAEAFAQFVTAPGDIVSAIGKGESVCPISNGEESAVLF